MEPGADLTREKPAVIAGAGPAGLTAAYELARRQIPVVVLEQDTQVGGLARTVSYRGFRFDIGGHRFFTKIPAVQALWRQMLGEDFLERPRLSRILYRGRFFDYPLKPLNVVRNLGLGTTSSVLASYAIVKLKPIRPEISFADWVSNRFGRRLYEVFFKTYTEKIWGMPAERISAEWAAQRIKGLSLRTAAINMLSPAFRGKSTIKTLIHEFGYPRLGPGMMWERFAERVRQHGDTVQLSARVVGIAHDGSRVEAVDVDTPTGRKRMPAGCLISTMPIAELVRILDPAAPDVVAAAARRLKHRDFLTVALVINQPHVFPDNWIYIHDDSVRVGRIQNYKNWSPAMVPDASYTCLGLEYFTNRNDEVWSLPDAELIALASRELSALGLAPPGSVVDGMVVRMANAYPVYDAGYLDALDTVKQYLARFGNLQSIGRNGLHKYNNQDHSMLTALLAVDNILGARHDIWRVNADDEYHEEMRDQAGESSVRARAPTGTQPLVPHEIGVEFRERRRF